jgi:hypothetical protein
MNPGVYILQAGISIGGNATVTNNTTGGDGSGGVMLYTTGGSSGLSGSPDVALGAPASETSKSILMWQDKSDTQSAAVSGGSSMFLNGALYFPTAARLFGGAALIAPRQ